MTYYLSFSLLFAAACTDGGEVPDELPGALGDCDESADIGWADVEPVFAAHCTSCHASTLASEERQDAPVGVNFDSPETARLNADMTWMMVRSEQMPRDGVVPFEEAMLLWEWLSCGGPE